MSSALPPGLHLQGLDFAYPGKRLFNHFSTVFKPGLTWVRGHNGCGKSTLLRLLAAALEPQHGRMLLVPSPGQEAIDRLQQPLPYRRHVAWCDAEAVAFDHLLATEYFGFMAGLYPGFDEARLGHLLPALGLLSMLRQPIAQLSTGTQKKVALSAVLASGCTVRVLDEPLASLDADSVTVLRAELLAAATQRQQVWIVSSHEGLGAAEAHAQVLDLEAPALQA
jgi:ABC-2 type transport system ATP-binding protein